MKITWIAIVCLVLGAASVGCDDGTAPGTDASLAIDAQSIDAAGTDATMPPDATASTDARVAADTGSGDGGCAPLTNDPSAIGRDCGPSSSAVCPTGYTCHGFSGIVFAESCEILCERSCECPSGHECVERSDKAGTWMQCAEL